MPLHKRIFFFLLLLFPTQLAIHYWPSWSKVYGIKIDYLSPTIFPTDLIILTLFIIYFPLFITKVRKITRPEKIVVFLLFILAAINILASTIPYLSLYKWAKVLEYLFFILYIGYEIKIKTDLEAIIKTLSFGIIIESALAIAQFLNQASLNSFLYFLGERTFTISTPGIARVAINGSLLLRPYATFPHPNAMAGYLAILLPFILTIDFKPIIIKWTAFIIGNITLFLTFSRPAILIGLISISLGWLFEQKNQNTKLLKLSLPIVVFSIIIILISVFFAKNIYLENSSISRRHSLNIVSLEMFKLHPLTGVGLGNFIPNLPYFSKDKELIRFLQPAHNIFLLTLAETGLIGFAGLIILIIFSFKKIVSHKPSLWKIQLETGLISILLLGLLDHYFFTLQQTQLLFILILGLIWARKQKPARINP